MMKDTIVGIGEALWDCLPEGRKLGGAPANFAYHVGQFGWRSTVVSAVGNDALGDEILQVFDKVKLSHDIARVGWPTGTVQVTLSEDGIPSYEICEDVAWDNIPWTEELAALAARTKAVCFGSLAQRSPVSRQTIMRFLASMERIIAGVKDGSISQAELDRNVRNMLEYIVRTPRFQGYKYSNKPDLKAHAKLVHEATAEGLILLENNGVLPLKDVKTVALYGTGSYDFIAGGTGSGNVNKAYVRNVAEGFKANGIEVDADIQQWYEQYITFTKTQLRNNAPADGLGILLGDPVVPEMEISRSFIEKKLKATDFAVLTISRNAGEGDDRKAADGDWTLTGQERELLQTLADVYHAAGKKLVVVLNIGGVIETASWKHIPDAILLAWTPGQEGGLAVADVLCGASNPSGKLPMTFPVSYFDIPSSFNFPFNYKGGNSIDMAALLGMGPARRNPVKDIDYTDYAEGIWVGYRYFATAGKPVSYPFGYGLSYTTFSYSKPAVKVDKNGKVTATVTVTNTGKVAGKEVVELYVTAPDGGLVKPVFELKGFAKTKELRPGASETVTITIDPYTLASFNETTSAWETAAGNYTVHFGASSADIRGAATFKLAKPQSWPVHRVLLPAEPVKEISVK